MQLQTSELGEKMKYASYFELFSESMKLTLLMAVVCIHSSVNGGMYLIIIITNVHNILFSMIFSTCYKQSKNEWDCIIMLTIIQMM